MPTRLLLSPKRRSATGPAETSSPSRPLPIADLLPRANKLDSNA